MLTSVSVLCIIPPLTAPALRLAAEKGGFSVSIIHKRFFAYTAFTKNKLEQVFYSSFSEIQAISRRYISRNPTFARHPRASRREVSSGNMVTGAYPRSG